MKNNLKRLVFCVIIGIFLSLVFYNIVKAIPPFSPYLPGETLDPSCSPGDLNCTVLPSLTGTSTIGNIGFYIGTTTLSGDTNLFWDNTNKQLGLRTTTPAYTLDINGTLRVISTSTFNGNVGIGITNPAYRLDVMGSVQFTAPAGSDTALLIKNDLDNLVRIGDFTTTTLENTNLRYASQFYVRPLVSSTESAAVYLKIDPIGIGNLQIGIYGEVTSNQEDGEGAFMKIVHYGAGDAIYVPLFTSGGVAFEAASFTDGTKGIISTMQAPGLAHSTLFNALWGQSTVPFYGMYYADQSPGNAFTIRKIIGASDNQTQIRILEPDMSRERFSVYNNGDIRLSSLAASSTATIVSSPSLYFRGAYWTGLESSDLDFKIQNIVSDTTPSYRLSFQNNSSNELMVIENNGNVGIGTTAPSQKLTVVGNIGIQAGANAFIGTLDNYGLSLRTNNTDRIFITNTGNVGIGTTAPEAKLHIDGDVLIKAGSSDIVRNYLFEVKGPIKVSGIRNTLLRNDLVSKTGLIIPFYRYPWAGGTWDSVFESLLDILQKYHEVPVFVIINPSNGPGSIEDVFWRRAIKKLHGAGTVVLGYVYTNYTSRNINEVKADIDAWRNLYPEVDGLFVDEMTSDDNQGHRDYYIEVTRYAHKKGFYPVVANPGTEVPGNYFAQDTADIIIIWENSSYPNETTLKGGDWEDSYREIPVWRRAVLVHSQPSLSYSNIEIIRKYVGLLYVTDDEEPNPWDTLPSYLENLLSYLARNGRDVTSADYDLVIGTRTAHNLRFITNNTEKVIITSSGNVGIGTTAPGYKLDVQGSIRQTNATNCTLSADANGQIICTVSSQRYKTNIQDLSFDINKFLALSPKSFDWNTSTINFVPGEKGSIGFIAEEVNEVFPELVRYKNGQPEGIKYEILPIYLFKVVKDLILGFTEKVKASLNEIGIIIENGVAKIKEIFTEKITTKQICLEGDDGETICLDKNQLKELLNRSGGSYTTINNNQNNSNTNNSTNTTNSTENASSQKANTSTNEENTTSTTNNNPQESVSNLQEFANNNSQELVSGPNEQNNSSQTDTNSDADNKFIR